MNRGIVNAADANRYAGARKIVLAVIFILVFVFLLALSLEDILTQKRLEKSLQEANYCETYADCVVIQSKCPLGCYALINAEKRETIERALDAFVSHCAYGCAEPRTFSCVDNRCVWEPGPQ